MPINPMTGLEEEDEFAKIFSQADADRKRITDEQSSYDTTGAISGALAALGAGIQGKDSVAAANQMLDRRRQAKQDELSALDKWKQGKIQELQAKRDQVKAKREDEKYAQDQSILARERDINSQESKMANELAASMGYKGAPITAEQFKQFSPVLQKRYEIEQQRLSRQEAGALRNSLVQEARDQRNFDREKVAKEKEQSLKTPFGLANTVDDAKQLKDAFEAKKNFDAKLDEMIKLRKNKGVEYWDREAVARGKQLSKDLLLEYKNMAKLGVLSAADQEIINTIIPEDPLAQDWMPGQDSIMSNMEKFKADSDRDFATRVATRTRSGIDTAANPIPENNPPGVSGSKRQVVDRQINKKTGQTRLVYDDGSIEIVASKVAGGR